MCACVSEADDDFYCAAASWAADGKDVPALVVLGPSRRVMVEKRLGAALFSGLIRMRRHRHIHWFCFGGTRRFPNATSSSFYFPTAVKQRSGERLSAFALCSPA